MHEGGCLSLQVCQRLAGGSFDDPRSLNMERHIWTRSKYEKSAIK